MQTSINMGKDSLNELKNAVIELLKSANCEELFSETDFLCFEKKTKGAFNQSYEIFQLFKAEYFRANLPTPTDQNEEYYINEISISYQKTNIIGGLIKSSACGYRILKEYVSKDIEYQEVFCLIALNNSNEVLGIKKLFVGGITATVVDIRLIFQHLLKAHAVSFILCHNHPSGKLQPSKNDLSLTQEIKQAGNLMKIKLLDHLIITKESYYSFADEGII